MTTHVAAAVERSARFVEPARRERAAICRHCGAEVPGSRDDGFCCSGCRAVHRLLREEGLERYYDLRGGRGQPVGDTKRELADDKWIELVDAQRGAEPGLARVDLDVQGLHCAGCVWLIDELFRREPGAASVIVNPALGTMALTVDASFPLRHFVEQVEAFGYVLGPARKEGQRRVASDLLLRMGVCIAFAMNSMIFAIALYAGLDDPLLFRVFHLVDFGLATAAVLVGGSVFFRSAWQALRRGVLHLDLPISLGIAAAYAGSLASLVHDGGHAAYFDTITVFVALMLVGRFLQERVLEKNRAELLDDAGIEGLLTRRIESGRVEIVPVRELCAGDALLVAPGDIVPVAAVLEDDAASFSLDWITGESAPHEQRRGDAVRAGACVAGASAARLRAVEPFERSALRDLLRTPASRGDAPRASAWWGRVAGWYVAFVLVAAAVGFAAWMIATGDLARASRVVTAVLVVTCPCALGIATPLAYEIVQAGLRREGLLVRSATLLERLAGVRRVVFDKTGTLTTGVLRVENEAALDALDPSAQRALYDLAARSTHPKSIALKRALAVRGARLDPAARVEEEPGKGLTLEKDGHAYRLGAPGWAGVARAGAMADGDVAFSIDGEVVASFVTREDLRPDACAEVQALRDDAEEVFILSGDSTPRVRDLARAAGVPDSHAIGDATPEGKAAWLAEHDGAHALMLGDGINDALALAAARCSGTPAIDRPFLAARADFYLVAPGLRPIRLALRASRKLERVVRRILVAALAYNVLAVALAYAGVMSPVLCAVLMPTSSITIVVATAMALGRGAAWR